jgi:hypothetical protein
MFTSLALFALVWALLLPYYGRIDQSELFAAFGGFLLVYVGGLLIRESTRDDCSGDSCVSVIDRLSVWLLPIIAFPTAISLFHPNGEFELISKQELELILAVALTVLGFISIARGSMALFAPLAKMVLIPILLAYSILEVAFLFSVLDFTGNVKPMDPFFKCAFAIAKIVLAMLFSFFVAEYGMPEELRRQSLLKRWSELI